MSQHSAGTRRARFARVRKLALVGVVAGALSFASPSFAAVVGAIIQIPGASAPSNLTVGVDDTLGLPNAVVDASSLNTSSVTLDNLLGLTNINGGLTQTTTTLQQLLSGLQTGAAIAAPVVQATATDAVATAITNLQARAQDTAAEALALDPNAVNDATTGVIADLEGQATSEVAGLLPLALTSGLQVVQNIVSPVCSLTAIPSSFLPGIGVDTTRLYTAVAPVIQQTDVATNQLLRDTYSQVYDNTLASVNNIPTAGPILSALLLLLKYNWTTSYTPPGSTTPVVTTTKALMNVPTPIDVDHDGLFDLCGTTSFALTGSGSSISGIKLTQTITKMPLAKPVLPVDIDGGLLNVINVGYNSTESSVPIVYTGSATLDTSTGGRLSYDGTYAVNRGTNLTIPPASLSSLALSPGVVLPTFPPLLTPAPKPIITQKFCIGGCAAIMGAYRHENVPTSTHVDTPLASLNAIDVNYTGSESSDSFGYRFNIGAASSNIGVSTLVGGDRPAVGTAPARVFSAPTAARSCFGALTCSPYALTGDTNVAGFTASAPTSLDQDIYLASANTQNVCTGVGALNQVVRINDSSQFYTGAKKGAAGVGTGHLAIDTGGKPIDGCTGLGSLGVLGGGTQLTLPTGFTANNRAATYHQSGLGQPIPDTKTGSATCPTGTVADYSLVLATAHLQPVICPTPVTPGTVTINGSPVIDNTITAATSGWGPGAPNAPTFTYQWNKCAADGSNCQPIAGATSSSYTLQYGPEVAPPPTDPSSDYHHKFTVTVKGTNLDSNESVTSAPTPLVELPPPPLNTVLPTLGTNRKVGVATTLATIGTWNPGATSYLYRWQSCMDAAGMICSDISGATGSATNAAGVSFTLTPAQKALYIRVGVKGKNHGGISPEVFTATGYVPGDPVNTSPPGIKNGPANAVNGPVATGDNLAATPGTWTDTNSAFTYQWLRCDASGNACSPIGGATSVGYTVNHPNDDGHTLRVAVGAHGLNGDTTATSGATGVVIFNDLSAKPAKDVVDGTVNATVASDHGTAYIGGSFDTAGPSVSGGGKVGGGSAASGKAIDHQAQVRGGVVKAVAPDGIGGYFLGGSFDHVAGAPDPCPGVAHIQANGSLDPTYCKAGLVGAVNAVDFHVARGVLAVGGSFTLAGHSNLVFLDNLGAASFGPDGDPNGAVNAIADDSVEATGVRFYVGGDFTAIGAGASYVSNHLAAYEISGSGPLTVTRPTYAMSVSCAGTANGCASPASATVLALTYVRSHYPGAFLGSIQLVAPSDVSSLLIGGTFDRLAVQTSATNTALAAAVTRGNAAAITLGATPTVTSTNGTWNPNANNTVRTIAVPRQIAVDSSGNVPGPTVANVATSVPVYLGGDFTSIGSAANAQAVSKAGEFGFGNTSGCASCQPNSAKGVQANASPSTTWTPSFNGSVRSLSVDRADGTGTVYAAGDFTTVGTSVRHRLAALGIAGAAAPTLGTWDPNAGNSVNSIVANGGGVFVGGTFKVLGGVTRNNLAELEPNTGVTGWNPGSDGVVNALAVLGGKVYVGGSFANVGGAARQNLAAVDGSTGVLTGWNPGASGAVNAIDTQSNVVYIGGQFGTLAGAARSNLGGVNTDGTVLAGWTPNPDGTVYVVRATGGTDIYVGGAFANIGGQSRNNAAAISTDGNATPYNPNADGAVRAIVVNLGDVYLGGDFANVGGQARSHVARTDVVTGAVSSWNPSVDGAVNALYLVGSQLFVGGQFSNAGGAARGNLAALDTGSDSALPFNPAPNGTIKAITRTTGGSLAVGGAFSVIADQIAAAVGFFGG